MVRKEFVSEEAEVIEQVDLVKKCVRVPHLITVYELGTKRKSDVDVAIIKGLLKKEAWNRVDVAKSEIFTENRRWKTGQLDGIMMSAIKHNNHEFVELILDNDFNLNRLDIKFLDALYDQISMADKDEGKDEGKDAGKGKKKGKDNGKDKHGHHHLKYIGLILQRLLGAYYKSHHLGACEGKDTGIDHEDKEPKNELQMERSAQELFLWAVLMNYQDMAKLFWRRVNEPTAAALVAYSLLEAIAARTPDTGHVVQSLHSNAQEFEDLAVNLLNKCFHVDQQKAQDLLG
nr:hypothetical protein BaRGS_021248 [Batillaria attramentaria]